MSWDKEPARHSLSSRGIGHAKSFALKPNMVRLAMKKEDVKAGNQADLLRFATNPESYESRYSQDKPLWFKWNPKKANNYRKQQNDRFRSAKFEPDFLLDMFEPNEKERYGSGGDLLYQLTAGDSVEFLRNQSLRDAVIVHLLANSDKNHFWWNQDWAYIGMLYKHERLAVIDKMLKGLVKQEPRLAFLYLEKFYAAALCGLYKEGDLIRKKFQAAGKTLPDMEVKSGGMWGNPQGYWMSVVNNDDSVYYKERDRLKVMIGHPDSIWGADVNIIPTIHFTGKTYYELMLAIHGGHEGVHDYIEEMKDKIHRRGWFFPVQEMPMDMRRALEVKE